VKIQNVTRSSSSFTNFQHYNFIFIARTRQLNYGWKKLTRKPSCTVLGNNQMISQYTWWSTVWLFCFYQTGKWDFFLYFPNNAAYNSIILMTKVVSFYLSLVISLKIYILIPMYSWKILKWFYVCVSLLEDFDLKDYKRKIIQINFHSFKLRLRFQSQRVHFL